MGVKLFMAILYTRNKTKESIIKELSCYDLSNEKIGKIIEYYNQLDGAEVLVMQGYFDADKWKLVGWSDKYDEQIKEAIYTLEQDEVFGMYVNDREGFEEAWNKEDGYEFGDWACFNKEDVEILESVVKSEHQNHLEWFASRFVGGISHEV